MTQIQKSDAGDYGPQSCNLKNGNAPASGTDEPPLSHFLAFVACWAVWGFLLLGATP